MATKKKLTKKELDFYKERLLELREQILSDLKHLESDGLNKGDDAANTRADMVDAASENFEREFAIGLASNEQQTLNKIDVALRKVEDGTYGICEKLGTPIPKKRLLALPYAILSLKAQEELEKERLS